MCRGQKRDLPAVLWADEGADIEVPSRVVQRRAPLRCERAEFALALSFECGLAVNGHARLPKEVVRDRLALRAVVAPDFDADDLFRLPQGDGADVFALLSPQASPVPRPRCLGLLVLRRHRLLRGPSLFLSNSSAKIRE